MGSADGFRRTVWTEFFAYRKRQPEGQPERNIILTFGKISIELLFRKSSKNVSFFFAFKRRLKGSRGFPLQDCKGVPMVRPFACLAILKNYLFFNDFFSFFFVPEQLFLCEKLLFKTSFLSKL